MTACINVDWLALYCMRETQETIIATYPYSQNIMEYGTRQYRFLSTILYKGEEIAYLQYDPYSKILHPLGCIIKFANRLLYSPSCYTRVNDCLAMLGLHPQSISRLDIAADFTELLSYGRPEQLIEDFVQQSVRKVGRARGTLAFRQGKDGMKYNGITFGTRDSDARVYMYNKSMELREVQDKPYIRDYWRACGLNLNKDVWRIEIAMHAKTLNFANKETGEIRNIEIGNLQSQIVSLFTTMLRSLFKFVIPDNKNVTRCTKVALLPETFAVDRQVLRNVTGSNRAEKVLIHQLHDIIKKYRYFQGAKAIETSANCTTLEWDMVKACDLQEWYRKKAPKWDKVNYKPQ